MTITPDTKNWTWVLQRPCPECGFAAGAIARDEVPTLLRANAEAWRRHFAEIGAEDAATRPDPSKWSPLEYACHVRDCNKIYLLRVGLILDEDDPEFPNWDQDATAVEDEYNKQDLGEVVAALVETGEHVAPPVESL